MEEWLGNEFAWNDLVGRSATDALFLSWEWLTNWWHCYGSLVSAVCLRSWLFYQGADLVGLAPLYCRRLVRGGFVPTHSVQFLGLSWRDDVPLISEYLDVIAAAADLERVREACVRFLLRRARLDRIRGGLHTGCGPLARALHALRCAASALRARA